MKIKLFVFDTLEPTAPPTDGWPGYTQARVLIRRGPHTLGLASLPLRDGQLDPDELNRAANAFLGRRLDLLVAERLGTEPAEIQSPASLSVVVCTRDRAEHLRRCLAALAASRPAPAEIIVVDNASATAETREVAERAAVRYVREDRPGLNWARSRGAEAATGDVVVYVDDDVIVSADWLYHFPGAFADPGVAAVTGLVMPYRLDTASERMFEEYCGFIRGFARRRFDLTVMNPLAAGQCGAGACMAVRRDLINELGLFRIELDAGTAARTGGDTYAYYRLITLGFAIEYVPDIVVWHQHRDSAAAVVSTLRDYSVGTYVYFLHCFLRHRERRALSAGMRWFREYHLHHLFGRLLGAADAHPLAVTLAEIRGCFAAPIAYWRSRRADRLGGRPVAAGESPA